MESSGQGISSLVDQSLVSILLEMGISKAVSEKALFLTQAKSIEPAIDWIQEHENDPDFEEELQIVQGTSNSSLSKEEAAIKARELQQKLKRDRDEKEKELEIEREKERIRVNKELLEAKRKAEEQDYKRAVEERMREKKRTQDELKQQQDIIRREKEERFGKKFDDTGAAQKTPQEKITEALKAIKTLYPSYRNPGVAKTTITTLRAYTSNLLNNPAEPKYRSIKIENKAFQERIAKVAGGIKYLTAVGFIEENGFYTYNSSDFSSLELGLKLIDEVLSTLDN
jgi:UBX domain-containing protein 1/4